MAKPQKCRAEFPHQCRYHGALIRMEQAANKKDLQGYLAAREEAEKHAHDDERSWFGKQLTSLESHAEAQGELVRKKDGVLDERFTESESSAVLYMNPNLSDEEREKLERVHAISDALSAPVQDRQAREVEAAYRSKNFGREAEYIHPQFKRVDASLVDFEPVNPTHAALVRSMVEAVVDQRYAMHLASGEEIAPLEVALQMEHPDAEMVMFVDERSPEEEFNHGWLFSFYEAVAEAKWDRSSVAYPSGGAADRAKVEENFVRRQKGKWENAYRRNPSAFNSGAVSGWETWLDGLR